jgi:hypothetical protein
MESDRAAFINDIWNSMAKSSLERIRLLLKGYHGSGDTTFAIGYRLAVSDGVRSGELTDEQVAALDQARATVEGWYQRQHDPAANPIEEWLALVEAVSDKLPHTLLNTLLSRIPQNRRHAIDWARLVFERSRSLLRVFVEQKVLRPADLTALAKADAVRFYGSVGLDVLLETNTCPPRTLWAALAGNLDRSAGMLSGPEAIADAYALDSAADSSLWLTGILASLSAFRSAVLLQILRDAAALEKLARYLSAAQAGPRRKTTVKAANEAALVLGDLVPLCAQAVESGKNTARGAAWAIGIIAVGAHSPTSPFPPALTSIADDGAGRVTRARLLPQLQCADEGRTATKELIVATDAQIHHTIQTYLQLLPMGASAAAEPAERGAQHQRYLGRKEVIQELLSLLSETETSDIPRAALDAALFNVGLRPLGVSGESATFNPHRHESSSPGIIRGDTTTIARPGWQVGDGEQAVVLEKAHVILKPRRENPRV